jgi:DNA mismatch repair ATPase MutS
MDVQSLVSAAYSDKTIANIKDNFKWTPVFVEWKKIKEETCSKYGKNSIILMQVGNFYESYFEDAYIYSKIVNASYTRKSKKDEFSAPMS